MPFRVPNAIIVRWGKFQDVDLGYFEIDDKSFYLRSGGFYELILREEHGVGQVYYRRWSDGSTLLSDGVVY